MRMLALHALRRLTGHAEKNDPFEPVFREVDGLREATRR